MVRIIHLIVNPKSGIMDNRALTQLACSFFNAKGIKVTIKFTERNGHATSLAFSSPYAPGKIICGLGGDGTMHEIINGIMQRKPQEQMPVGLLPGGTGNSFLEDMGLLKFNKALDAIAVGNVKKVDLFKVNMDEKLHYAFNVCGWGLFASGNACAESLRWVKRQRYNVAGLWEILRNRRQWARFSYLHQTIEDSFSLIVASNTRFVGKGMLLSPEARCDDGKMDLTFLKQSDRLALVRMFLKLPNGTHIDDPNIHYLQTDSFEIQTPKPTLWNFDGEIHSGKKGQIKVMPSALKVCM